MPFDQNDASNCLFFEQLPILMGSRLGVERALEPRDYRPNVVLSHGLIPTRKATGARKVGSTGSSIQENEEALGSAGGHPEFDWNLFCDGAILCLSLPTFQ